MNIIVNGGSRGIGKEVVLLLSQDTNNQIIVTGRNEMALKSLSACSSNIHPVTSDISIAADLEGTFTDKIFGHFKRVDVLINMAGELVSKGFMEIEDKEARLMMETNFFGPAAVIRIVKPLMPEGSHIVNISSMGGFQGSVKFTGLSYYSASKAAIACLSECLAQEFKGSGISVNCIALGAVQTEMLGEAFPGYKAPVEAFEIAPFISYFALNGHRFMNGKILPVALNNP
jgi:NAD(P)-dependent dehydrogenase (short-subunit alcohol dehydrogenase family)